jgi:hypothetical protein
MEKHVNIIAALQIGLSILHLIISILIISLLKLVFQFIDEPNIESIASSVLNFLSNVFVIISIPGIIAGFGLYKRYEWGRILTIVISVFEVLSFPLGTVLGIYSIWGLTQPEVVAIFNKKETQHN